MNTQNMWIACLSGAVLTTVVSNLPFIGIVNCLLCAGFWGSAIFSVWLYRRLSGAPTMRQVVVPSLLLRVSTTVPDAITVIVVGTVIIALSMVVNVVPLLAAGGVLWNLQYSFFRRLGLPPLGIVGINMKVTGPMEDLKIKFGKGGTGEETKETEYSDELPKEMLDRIKSAKDDGDGQEEPQK